jgi:hypothetical protein
MRHEQEFIERRIITGLIVSQEYIERVQKFWNPALLESPELKAVAQWCINYFKTYQKPPDVHIQDLYMEALKGGRLSKADATYIEELLTSLSEEYGRDTQFNTAYLYDQTIKYFKSQELSQHQREVKALIDAGRVDEAEKLTTSFVPTTFRAAGIGLELSSEEALDAIDIAFKSAFIPVVAYPGALGNLWNEHLIRGGFVALLAPEKRGKSFLMMEIALRAARQKANVAYFVAGDMTEPQVLRRICVYISQKSDREKYCQERFRPVGDCVFNQLDLCTREDRNCDHGIFTVDPDSFFQQIKDFINMETLKKKFDEFPDYEPCDSHGCNRRKGSVWLKKIKKTKPLNPTQAKTALKEFFKKWKRKFKLVTHPAGTLTVSEMREILDTWERIDGFVPDVIVVDYADLLSADDGRVSEFRHRQDYVWKSLRALSQERHVLLVTATQADADSYKKTKLDMSNFSEDKRKMSHVTSQYGLNQDPHGREKKLGILRINEIIVREGDFSNDHEVTVLQDLAVGRSFLESFV